MCRGHDQVIFGHKKNRRFALLSLDFAVWRFAVFMFLFFGGVGPTVSPVSPLYSVVGACVGAMTKSFFRIKKNRRFALLSLDFAVWRFAGFVFLWFRGFGPKVSPVSPLYSVVGACFGAMTS